MSQRESDCIEAIIHAMELLAKFLETEERIQRQERRRHALAIRQGVKPLIKQISELLFVLGQTPSQTV